MSVKKKLPSLEMKSNNINCPARSETAGVLSVTFAIPPFTGKQGKYIERMVDAGKSFNPQAIIGGPGRSRKQ